MELKIQIALIAGSFIVLLILMAITKKITKKVSLVKNLEPNRKKVVLNVFYFLYYIVFITAVIIILGIDLQEVSIFISSILAILGIALFAQWSLLSNLTASIIIFFYHPLKIGDRVKILDKEFDFTGEVIDITGFYTMIKTDEDQEISIPNSLVLQKGIKFFK
ncbi:MAG: mechanosensitive ion channel [Flavobacteriaceae bacterium]